MLQIRVKRRVETPRFLACQNESRSPRFYRTMYIRERWTTFRSRPRLPMDKQNWIGEYLGHVILHRVGIRDGLL